MSGGIYLIQDSGALVELNERPYEAEELLQRLLAEYPDLLAGDQVNPSAPRRWLLVSREMSILDGESGPGRWALDHLFLDQDGVPTLVEVKRSSDTRLRREVVGQMLDYAANAVVYWPAEAMKAHFEAACELNVTDPVEALTAFLGGDSDPDSFWQGAKRNLQAGRIRMVFVADIIPPELRRIVEFLNEQMDPAEVIALEIRQFVGEGVKALVPKVVGQTARAQQAKGGTAKGSNRKWDEQRFFAELEKRPNSQEITVARELLEWAHQQGLRLRWGSGAVQGSFYPMLDKDGFSEFIISVWTDGAANIELGHMVKDDRRHPTNPFTDETNRRQLLMKFNAIPGINISADAISKYPRVPLVTLVNPGIRRQFLNVLDWLVASIRSGQLVDI
jgi:hypothetical protein